MKTLVRWLQHCTGFGRVLLTVLVNTMVVVPALAAPPSLKTQNVFLIISDGFRWQEVFTGAEEILMTRENGGVADTNALRAQFWRHTPAERREALLPFFWTGIARRGQL